MHTGRARPLAIASGVGIGGAGHSGRARRARRAARARPRAAAPALLLLLLARGGGAATICTQTGYAGLCDGSYAWTSMCGVRTLIPYSLARSPDGEDARLLARDLQPGHAAIVRREQLSSLWYQARAFLVPPATSRR